MNHRYAFAVPSLLILLAVALLPSSRADEWDKRTILTVNEPLAVPGKVLQPGKYVMKLAELRADRHIVQIFNEDESKLETTIIAIPNYRLQPTGQTQFSFWEMPAGQPHALRAWFYPGDNFGQEFAYAQDEAAIVANANHENVPTVASEKGEITQTAPQNAATATQPAAPETTAHAAPPPASEQSAPSSTTEAQSQPAPAAPSPAPSNPEPNMQQQAQTQPAPQTGAAESLPRTASPYPLVGLGGLLSLALALTARGLSGRER
ncbi:MAG: hypothetical protein ACM336_06640 [Acidobacteriota bacterium]